MDIKTIINILLYYKIRIIYFKILKYLNLTVSIHVRHRKYICIYTKYMSIKISSVSIFISCYPFIFLKYIINREKLLIILRFSYSITYPTDIPVNIYLYIYIKQYNSVMLQLIIYRSRSIPRMGQYSFYSLK